MLPEALRRAAVKKGDRCAATAAPAIFSIKQTFRPRLASVSRYQFTSVCGAGGRGDMDRGGHAG